VFDLGNHYLQSSNQKLLTGGPGGGGHSSSHALTLGTTAGPLTTSEVKAVKGMPSEAVIGRWKETVRELGNILVQVGRWLGRVGRCCWVARVARQVHLNAAVGCTGQHPSAGGWLGASRCWGAAAW